MAGPSVSGSSYGPSAPISRMLPVNGMLAADADNLSVGRSESGLMSLVNSF